MKKSAIILTALISVATVSLANANDGEEWRETTQENGIVAFVGAKNSNGIRPTRAIMTVNASAEQVLEAIMNVAQYTEWVPKCDEAREIEGGTDSSVYFYQVFSAPFIKDRDLVTKAIVSEQNGNHHIRIVATPRRISADWNKVRIKLFKADYTITSLADGKTRVEMRSEIDMEGIPAFMLNWANESQPYQTFSQLRQHILNN